MSNKNTGYSVITLGEGTVGKTSLLNVIVGKPFSQSQVQTVGMDFWTHTVEIRNSTYKIKLWDSAGQERYAKLAKQYLRKCDGWLLVYDISKKQTFDNVQNWLERISEAVDAKDFPMVLIGNKCDLPNREVTTEMGKEFASQHNMAFFEASALTGKNVQEALVSLINTIINKIGDKAERKSNLNLIPSHQVEKKFKC